MNSHHVDKLECPVTLFLCDGMVREGSLFLNPASASHGEAQTPLELANKPTPYFAFRKTDGSFSLVNKATVSHLRFRPGPVLLAPGPPLEVRIVFSGGEVLQGTLTLTAAEEKGSLEEILNARRDFFLLDCGSAHYLVNSRLICEIALP
jgi:hypothetical protein